MKRFLAVMMTLTFVLSFATVSQAGDAGSGKGLFKSKKCATCHKVDTEKAKMGPGLKGIGGRRGEAWMTKWMADPKAVWAGMDDNVKDMAANRLKKKKDPAKYKVKMPSKVKKLSDGERADLVAYLMTL